MTHPIEALLTAFPDVGSIHWENESGDWGELFYDNDLGWRVDFKHVLKPLKRTAYATFDEAAAALVKLAGVVVTERTA